MHIAPVIRQYVFAQVTTTLERMNGNVERTLSRNGIPDWRDNDGKTLVPLVHFIKALEAGSRAIGDEQFSMRVAEDHNLVHFADFGAAIRSGTTVYDAMRISCRLISTQVPTLKFWVSKRKGGALLCRKQSVRSPGLERPLQLLERYTMLLLLNIIRTGAGAEWKPSSVYLSTQSDEILGNWSEFEGADVVSEAPCSAIFVPDEILVLPVRNQPIPSSEKDAIINKQLARDELGANFVNDIQGLTVSLLRTKSANLQVLSEVTMISKRTLQRKLAEEGQTFQSLLDRARFDLATEILTLEGATVADASDLTAYEHPQHFIRAFRRWTGVTPGQFREIHAAKN